MLCVVMECAGCARPSAVCGTIAAIASAAAQVLRSFERFDAAQSQCFKPEDREAMLVT